MSRPFDKKRHSSKSLLRYPGGKTRAVKIITKYFPKDMKDLCSPFFGGGSIELYMASQGVKVYGADAFKSLVEFWHCALTKPKQLAKLVERYYPLDKTTFYQLQKKQSQFKSKLIRAAVFYVLNRSSFSGTTLSGGMSPNHPRFTTKAIEQLKHFIAKNISIECSNFRETIEKYKDVFLYLDPPYATSKALYGMQGDAHKNFDHAALHEMLRNRINWILSYNDCPYIRKLYAEFRIKKLKWKYGMNKTKQSNEVIIFSRDMQKKR